MEIKKSKLYTKTGDQGMTRLVDGSCVEKFNPRVEAYGCVDELNSSLGFVRSQVSQHGELNQIDPTLEMIQNHLFRIGSLLACEKTETIKMLPTIDSSHVELLEKQIDLLDNELPELKNFVLPGGHPIAASLHMARTFCRRAERRSAEVNVIKDTEPEVQNTISTCLIYLNRLSDYLFVASRWVNLRSSVAEVIWKR